MNGYLSNHAMYQNNSHETYKKWINSNPNIKQSHKKKKHYPLGRVSFMSNRESDTIKIWALAMNDSKFLKGGWFQRWVRYSLCLSASPAQFSVTGSTSDSLRYHRPRTHSSTSPGLLHSTHLLPNHSFHFCLCFSRCFKTTKLCLCFGLFSQKKSSSFESRCRWQMLWFWV